MGSSVAGGCHCGAVRIELKFPTDFCSHCHCEDCRRTHGAAFVTWTAVPRERFRFTLGEERVRWYESHPGVRWGFCERCGSSLLYRGDDVPERMYIVRACLEGRLDRDPDSHVSFEEHADWGRFREELPRYLAKTEDAADPARPFYLARRFALALDLNDFARARPYLTADCRYDCLGKVLVGPDAILGAYEESYLSARDLLDEIRFESEVRELAPGEVAVEYLDRLRKGALRHEHRCRQLLRFEGDRIARIEHVELPGEKESLAEFFRAAGVERRAPAEGA